MPFPIKVCSVCMEEFELKPDKPGFADRCPDCSTPEPTAPITPRRMDADSASPCVKPTRLAGKPCATSCTAREAKSRVPIQPKERFEWATGCFLNE